MGQTICCLLLMTTTNTFLGMKVHLHWKFFFPSQLVWCCFLVQSCIAMVDYKIGVLSPWNTSSPNAYPFWAPRTLGAVSLAIDEVNNAGILSEGNSLQFVYRDTDCDSKQASGSAVELFSNDHVSSYVTPPCSTPCRSVADLTEYWHRPTMAWFCAETERALNEYKYFARTYAPFTSLCNIALTTMKYYEWESASIISPYDSTWKTLAFYINEHLENNDINVPRYYKYQLPLNLEQAKKILTDVRTVSHVIWLIVGGITTLEADEQLFMLAAHQLGMVKGDHVFLRIELYPNPGYAKPWTSVLCQEDVAIDVEDFIGEEELQTMLMEAYEAMLLFTYRLPQDGRIESLLSRVPAAFADLPYHANSTFPEDPKNLDEPASIMSAFLYDAVWMYALSLNDSLGLDTTPDGKSFEQYLSGNVSFEGVTGHVILDAMGDRVYNFSLLDLKFQNSSAFQLVGYLNGLSATLEMIPGASISWPGAQVPGKPICGYKGEECLDHRIIIAIVLGAVATVAIIITIPCISFKYRKFLASRDWLMEMEVLTFLPQHTNMAGGYPSSYRLPNVSNRLSVHSLHSTSRSTSQKNVEISKLSPIDQKTPEEMPGFALATYASETVVLRKVQLENFHLNKAMRQELKEMRWLVHDNLNRFLGICFPSKSSDIFYHIMEYCTKGSLRSVLANDEMALDLSFKMSFIFDIAKGMQYLHQSAIKSHGILCSRLCFLDARWVTKISGFGSISNQMFMEKNKKGADPEERFAKMLWTAPEVLRSEMPPKGSQKGDVYSFGIMLQEVLTRNFPYSEAGKTNKAIIRDVMKRKEPPFRPSLAELVGATTEANVISELIDLMKNCWEELPEDRPDFNAINVKLKHVQKGRKDMNIMDSMLSKMEKYTENLEKVVADRTGQLLEEKAKTDGLLYRMLPEAVADSLKKGEPYLGEYYDHVTLYFSDIVGFTSISAESKPMQVVTLLNDLYTCFDAVIEKFDVYKVETIGDAYMVSSGLPRRNGNQHAPQIAKMSLAMVEAVKTFRIRHLPDRPCQIRIGINSGPVAAGVVGLTMPRFCLFGDTVNTASRMESNGLPSKIHVSAHTATLLVEIGGFRLEVRGQMKIKGKGVMNTFWLMGIDDSIEGRPKKVPTPLNTVGKKISTDTIISQDSLLSPSNVDTFSTVSSMDFVIPKVPEGKVVVADDTVTCDNSKAAEDNTKNGDVTASNGDVNSRTFDPTNTTSTRMRSVSDVIYVRKRMASIAEDRVNESNPTESEQDRTETSKNETVSSNNGQAVHEMQNSEAPTSERNASESQNSPKSEQTMSPQKVVVNVTPAVTEIPCSPSKNVTNEIPVLPNVIVYNSEIDCADTPFSYTVKGTATLDLEASNSMVEVYDA